MHDTNYVVFGKLSWFMNSPNIIHPEITNKDESVFDEELLMDVDLKKYSTNL